MHIKIASRKSDLARLQAYLVADQLKKSDKNVSIEHEFSASFGDQNPDVTLAQMPEKGAFTSDFVTGLKEGAFDLVVHSWKDLPTDLPETSKLYTLKREDPRDVLFVKKSSLLAIKESKKISILTSSPRRVHHIEPFIKDFYPASIDEVTCHEVRGNIPTRLKKLLEQKEDGLIMAKAALDRLMSTNLSEFSNVQSELKEYLSHFHFMVLPLSCYPTAAAQGALAIEVLASRSDLKNILENIHCKETFSHVKKERELLKSLGGGCHQKVGMTSLPHNNGSFISASGLRPNGEVIKTLNFDDGKKSEEKFSKALSYPTAKKPATLFEREYLHPPIPHTNDIYISKDISLPKGYVFHEHQYVATAGLVTWKRLAKKGIWVNASSDSLGSPYGIQLEYLAGRKMNWLNLTHTESFESDLQSCATYKLINKTKDESADFSSIKNFYWMSGSQFKRAIELYPEIAEGEDVHHCCGAGKTFEEIKKFVPKERIKIYLTRDIWYKETIDD